MSENKPAPALFLNVDLELGSARDIGPLVTAVQPALFVLHHEVRDGDHFASFESAEPEPRDPDAVCRALLDVLEGLSGAALDCLRACDSIVFALGFESGDSALYDARVHVETIQRIAALKGEITITVYAPDPDRS